MTAPDDIATPTQPALDRARNPRSGGKHEDGRRSFMPFSKVVAEATLRSGRFLPMQLLKWRIRGWVEKNQGREFVTRAADGVRISAVWLPAYSGPAKRTPVLMLHGWGMTKELLFGNAELFRRHGHDVVLVDLRTHGSSTGRHITFGFKEKTDVAAVLDEAQSLKLIDGRVMSWGLSLGAATAIQHAAIDPRAARVVALAPFADMASAVSSFQRQLWPWWSQSRLLSGFDRVSKRVGFDMDSASTVHAAEKLQVPLLVVTGKADRHLSIAGHARRIVAAKRSGICRLIEVDRAHHFSLHRGRWPGMDEAIVGFFEGVD